MRRAKKKLERQGDSTLEAFIGPMILLKLFGSVLVAWLISAMGVAALGELIENKNTQDEFILVLLCIWGIYGISWDFMDTLEKIS